METDRIRVNLSVPDRKLLDDVLASASKLGFAIEARLTTIGVVSGTIESGHLAALQAIPGVRRVERDRRLFTP